jgi:hypothetical protein
VAAGGGRAAPVAVCAPHHATGDLVPQALQPDLAAGELHHAAGLCANMIEVEDADVGLAAVDAARCGERCQGEADVAFLRL